MERTKIMMLKQNAKRLVSFFMTCVMSISMTSVALAHSDRSNFESHTFVTEEEIIADRIFYEEMEAHGRNIIETKSFARTPTTKKLNVPYLSQNDSRWAGTNMPCGHGTYGLSNGVYGIGCAMTCYAMIDRYKNGSQATPVTFATAYNKQYGDPCNQSGDNARKILKVNKYSGTVSNQEANLNFIVGAIDKGRPVLIQSSRYGSHYILAYGYYITSNGNVTVYIRDPESSKNTLLSSYYPSYNIRNFAAFG